MNGLMESPTARKGVFVVVTALLAVLAFFATRGPGDNPAPVAPTAPTATGEVVVVPGDTTAGDNPAAGGTDVTDLPLSAATLAQTKVLAAQFVTAYTTYKYNQDDAKVLNHLESMLDKDPTLDLSGVIPTGTFKAGLVEDKYSTTSTATVAGVSTISKNLVAYVVTADVTTRRNGTATTAATTYLVTLTSEAGWGINNVEVADKNASLGGMD